MRQYQPIWVQIKKDKKATILAHGCAHPRIIQAVMKERSEDISYRNTLKRKGYKAVLDKKSDIDKGTLEFILTEIKLIGLEDL